MNYCQICGNPGASGEGSCQNCIAVQPPLPPGDRSVEFAKLLSETSIPDMVMRGKKYHFEPKNLAAIQDILIEMKGYERKSGGSMISARMYHLLGNFFSALGNHTNAIGLYEKAQRISPDNLILLREKIRTLEELGRTEDSRKEKKRLLSIQQVSQADSMTGKTNPPSPPPPAGNFINGEVPAPNSPPPFAPPPLPPPARARNDGNNVPGITVTGHKKPDNFQTAAGNTDRGEPRPPVDITAEEGPYSGGDISLSDKSTYGHPGTTAPEPPESSETRSTRIPTITDVKQQVQQIFLYIGTMNPTGISTDPALQLLQNVQELLTASDTASAMKSAEAAVDWCETTMKEYLVRCRDELIEIRELVEEADREGVPLENQKKELKYATAALSNENLEDFRTNIDAIRTHITNFRQMRKFNPLLKEFSGKLSDAKTRLGDAEPIPRIEEIMKCAVEHLMANEFEELESSLGSGNTILKNIEGIEEQVRELPGLIGEARIAAESGGSVDEVLGELLMAEEALDVDPEKFIIHYEKAKELLGREGERMRRERLEMQLGELKGEIGRLGEIGVDIMVSLDQVDGVSELMKKGEFVKVEEGMRTLNGVILNCYASELAKVGNLIEEARSQNLSITGIEEHLGMAVSAWNEQDRMKLYEELKALKHIVAESIEKGNYSIVLSELLADYKRYGEVVGSNKATMKIGELLGQATGMMETSYSQEINDFFTELRSKMTELGDMARIMTEISGLRLEIEKAMLPEDVASGSLRELSIAERVLDTNIGFAANYVETARTMVSKLKKKYFEERLGEEIRTYGVAIEELGQKGADISFARVLLEKIVDIEKERRFSEAEVLLEKLGEEVSEIKTGLYSDIARDRVIMLQTSIAEHGREGLDLTEVNELLGAAINEMQNGDLTRSMSLLDECDSVLSDRLQYRETIEILKGIRRDMSDLEGLGVDIKRAEKALQRARPELEKGNYDNVREYAEECRAKMNECYQQKEFLEILEQLYNEIDEARSVKIDMSAANLLAETARKDIMEFNFLKAKDSVERARDMIRRSVLEFHEMTELIKLAQQKIDETRAIGADISTLDALFDEMMDLAMSGSYSKARSKAKIVVEKSLSFQLSYISKKRSKEHISIPQPPTEGRTHRADVPPSPPEAVPPPDVSDGAGRDGTGNEEEQITDLLADIRTLYQKGPPPKPPSSVMVTRPLPDIHDRTAPANQPGPDPHREVGVPEKPPETEGRYSPESSGDLLAEIRNIYSRLDTTTMTCPYCSGAIPRDSTFCSQCGRTLK